MSLALALLGALRAALRTRTDLALENLALRQQRALLSRRSKPPRFGRQLLDHVIVLNEEHLRRGLQSYLRYYHGSRTHLALEKDAPEQGRVVALPSSAASTTATSAALHSPGA